MWLDLWRTSYATTGIHRPPGRLPDRSARPVPCSYHGGRNDGRKREDARTFSYPTARLHFGNRLRARTHALTGGSQSSLRIRRGYRRVGGYGPYGDTLEPGIH